VAFDKSGSIVACGTDEGFIKLYNESSGKLEISQKAHEDAVQAVMFDYNSKMLVSAGSDCAVNLWQ
jgi:sperm-associated antigen 16 protein